jgi:hypothetical protein
MAEHTITNLLKKLMGRSWQRKPHPAIFKTDSVEGECAICGGNRKLIYFDREMGQRFCENCLEYVELADRNLVAVCERPGPES